MCMVMSAIYNFGYNMIMVGYFLNVTLINVPIKYFLDNEKFDGRRDK